MFIFFSEIIISLLFYVFGIFVDVIIIKYFLQIHNPFLLEGLAMKKVRQAVHNLHFIVLTLLFYAITIKAKYINVILQKLCNPCKYRYSRKVRGIYLVSSCHLTSSEICRMPFCKWKTFQHFLMCRELQLDSRSKKNKTWKSKEMCTPLYCVHPCCTCN